MEEGLERSMSKILYFSENINSAIQGSGNVSIGFLIGALIVVAIVASIIGYLVGVGKVFGGLASSLTVVLFNMDNYVIIGSLILLVFSIYLSTTDENNAIALIILNIFSSIIFSWLLTKKTSIKDFKEKEEELALRSYRHINYIESAAKTASGTIDKYISEHNDITAEMQLILLNAKENIKYVQGGINTCKMDWFDLLSAEEKGKHNEEMNKDFGTVSTVISDAEINQEDV